MLKPDQSENIRFALVAGLGTLLKGVEQTENKDGWVSNQSTLLAEGVWSMRHLLRVFKTATSGNHARAEELGQQLFSRAHAVSEETINKEQDDVLMGLNMIFQTMRDDILPLILNLFKSGEVKQNSRVMQVVAELGMQFVSKSSESLESLAQVLLSDVDKGCKFADLMEVGSLLAALQQRV
jgi:hypothetical protein